ncbi:uncharacterized protein LOC143588992 [Bidens hawaiensis]|uniref:uncharacterized protein LOC143588992 n=1 Tax=Bidens hawaiensis TaxID=980011 RepID=UPI00404A2E29
MIKKHYVLDGPVPTEQENNAVASRKVLEKHTDYSTEVACIMLATMSSKLAKGLENLGAYEMLEQLKGMFQKQTRQESFDTMKQLISCRMEHGSPITAHVVKIKWYIDKLKKLDYPLSDEIAAYFILNSLPNSYDQVILNFNMNAWVKIVLELHGMLKTAKMNIPTKTNQVLMVQFVGVNKCSIVLELHGMLKTAEMNIPTKTNQVLIVPTKTNQELVLQVQQNGTLET